MEPQRHRPIWFAGALALLAVGIGLLLGDNAQDQANLAARYTARVSFPVFLVTYCASSLVSLWPNDSTRGLLRQRRQWGLGSALAHTIHLAALTTNYLMRVEVPSLQALLGGGGAYAIMYVMALTSNGRSMRALGIWWKYIHKVGIHWLWFIFAFTYFGRLFDQEGRMQGFIFFPFCLLALGLRIAAWQKKRSTSSQAAPSA